MTITIVLGAQFGGEGKGKICSAIGDTVDLSIHAGGPNSGHIVINNGRKVIFRCVPATALTSKGLFAIGAGGIIDLEILAKELAELKLDPNRLKIDYRALIIEERHRAMRKAAFEDLLSTGVGTGAVVAEHVVRNPNLKRAEDIKELQPYLADVATLIDEFDREGKHILIQGNQGFGLSLHHGDYPFVTHRDTSAAGICSAAGAAILKVKRIILAARTFPIRSISKRELVNEVDWDFVTSQANSKSPIIEHTSFYGMKRRVGLFDDKLFRRACMINGPTEIAVTFMDYLNAEDLGVMNYEKLSVKSKSFIDRIERLAGVPVSIIGTGPSDQDIIFKTIKLH